MANDLVGDTNSGWSIVDETVQYENKRTLGEDGVYVQAFLADWEKKHSEEPDKPRGPPRKKRSADTIPRTEAVQLGTSAPGKCKEDIFGHIHLAG